MPALASRQGSHLLSVESGWNRIPRGISRRLTPGLEQQEEEGRAGPPRLWLGEGESDQLRQSGDREVPKRR